MHKKTFRSSQQKKTDLCVLTAFIVSIPAKFMLLLVRAYQWFFSPLKQFFFGSQCGCRFQPTCSCYAYDAFAHFGFWKGLWFSVRRLMRCHPWHSGGFDPLTGTDMQER